MEIILQNGMSLFIDEEDSHILKDYKYGKWLAHYSHRDVWYCQATLIGVKPKKCVLLHRILLDAKADELGDHIDGNGLNNRRNNLRIANVTQNNQNKRPHINKISKYKGVSTVRYKESLRWRAIIQFDRKSNFLGNFENEIDAAKAYDKKAKELFGEYAFLNFP